MIFVINLYPILIVEEQDYVKCICLLNFLGFNGFFNFFAGHCLCEILFLCEPESFEAVVVGNSWFLISGLIFLDDVKQYEKERVLMHSWTLIMLLPSFSL